MGEGRSTETATKRICVENNVSLEVGGVERSRAETSGDERRRDGMKLTCFGGGRRACPCIFVLFADCEWLVE